MPSGPKWVGIVSGSVKNAWMPKIQIAASRRIMTKIINLPAVLVSIGVARIPGAA